MVQQRARLPCDVTSTLANDRVVLILWYRGAAGTPIYRQRGGTDREEEQTERRNRQGGGEAGREEEEQEGRRRNRKGGGGTGREEEKQAGRRRNRKGGGEAGREEEKQEQTVRDSDLFNSPPFNLLLLPSNPPPPQRSPPL
ncbi:hypothetical protein Pmani_027047 [Petrolisthes manimaculis]|uniref:Uncharacterized protein n=1 Tax=Petrolisthes manimaculis TaxID=1843537 RepID=A0AAE1P3H9_9EUCA|nr:hypothetical protein Pmani_027047 [Petrolisthes manimaculis]